MMSVLWEKFRRLAELERTLPDGCIDGTSVADWQAVLDLVRDRGWAAEVRGDRESPGIPHDAAELFPEEEALTIAVWPDARIQLNLFPIHAASIDFDFDTAEIDGPRAFDILLDAVAGLARAVSRDVRLSHEGDGSVVLMTVSAEGDVRWLDAE